ncbi:hypothetical protein NPIL_659061 [Nephila pilipes]|uniref:Uncharacterized protein n=1 Tax=Nephila pilipes TaxID=299642 RepID=A0A8X6NVM5_NEPPI|nr:hypothetical protein NPIL_659061 [Nephila pilipes]
MRRGKYCLFSHVAAPLFTHVLRVGVLFSLTGHAGFAGSTEYSKRMPLNADDIPHPRPPQMANYRLDATDFFKGLFLQHLEAQYFIQINSTLWILGGK